MGFFERSTEYWIALVAAMGIIFRMQKDFPRSVRAIIAGLSGASAVALTNDFTSETRSEVIVVFFLTFVIYFLTDIGGMVVTDKEYKRKILEAILKRIGGGK